MRLRQVVGGLTNLPRSPGFYNESLGLKVHVRGGGRCRGCGVGVPPEDAPAPHPIELNRPPPTSLLATG
jgi:hypothetical protein